MKSIDLIRALAITLIIVFHFFYQAHSDNRLRAIGFFGVSLFFIVSGYMLAKKYSYLESFSLKWFFKRYVKIAVLYYFSLIMIVVLFGAQSYSGNLWQNLLSHFLFVNSFFPDFAYGIISPAWFLVPFICLYILFPYLNRLVKKSNLAIVLIFIIMLFVRLKEGTYTSFSPLFFIGEFCFGIALVYNKKLIPIVSCLILFFVDWIMVVPFFLFLFMINIKSIRFGKIITFVGTNSLALFLLHESFMNVIFNKWSLFGLNRYLAILLLLVISFALVFLSNKLQRYLLSKIK